MKYHIDLYDEPFFCPACGWEGTGHQADDMDGYDGCIDIDVTHMVCPCCASDNRDQWLSVAQFLGGFVPAFDRAALSAEGAPLRGEVADCAALSQSLPDGNHGENLNQEQA